MLPSLSSASLFLIFSWLKLSVPISYREDFLIIILFVPLVCQPFRAIVPTNPTVQTKNVPRPLRPTFNLITDYIQEHSAKPNPDYFGLAKGKKCDLSPLGEFQQFLLDYKLNIDGTEHEVTPFLNSLYHLQSTLAFSNIFNQVKAGKTSDAETMLETGLFDLTKVPLWSTMEVPIPSRLRLLSYQKMATNQSAVFHGNIGTFWNRNTTYKQWGYQYFFDASYFTKQDSSNSFQYGLNDKIMMKDSINI